MNNPHTAWALLAVLVLTACEQTSAPENQSAADTTPMSLETAAERLSYAIGDGLGDSLRTDQVPLDVDAFAEGLTRAFEGREGLLSDDEIETEMKAFAQQSYEKAQAESEAQGEANLVAGTRYLFANAEKEGVVSLESGVQYRVLQAGDGPVPEKSDTVEVDYRGSLIDGTEFDSSYTRGESATFPVNAVIKGWSEVLQLMPVGSKWEVVIPPEHAYGERGGAGKIGPYATLVFQVELLNIVTEVSPANNPGAEG